VSGPRPGSEGYWGDLAAQHGHADRAVRSSLVDGKNNSRAGEPRDTGQTRLSEHLRQESDDDESHRYDCRRTYHNFELEAEDGETAGYRCNSWDCYCCAHRMRMNLIEEMERVVTQRPEMRRFLTLTVDTNTPGGTADHHEYITDRWNALRTEINDRYPGLSYIWVRHEGDENGRAHLHLLVDRYLPQSMLSNLSKRVGLGEVVDIRRVNARNAAKYLTSYLGKGALANLPKGLRRYGSSSDINLAVRGGGDDERDWRLLMDDYEITPVSRADGPLRREVTKTDIWLQKQHGGPLGLDPPDEPPPTA
jgi:hypothetical protein